MTRGRSILLVAFLLEACSSGASVSTGPAVGSNVQSERAPSAGSSAGAPTATPSPTHGSQSSAAAASERPRCPDRGGGACLGALAPGTHESLNFSPATTYTVPAGWQNFEDLPGNLSFVPPGGDVAGVDPGTSDVVGIATSVAVDTPDCAGLPAPGVGRTAKAIAHVLATRPGLTVSGPLAVTVGGLSGYRLDLRMAAGWKKSGCTDEPDVPLLVGVAPSDFVNTLLGPVAIRLYLLDHDGATLSIEIDDVSGGSHLRSYQPVIDSLAFGG